MCLSRRPADSQLTAAPVPAEPCCCTDTSRHVGLNTTLPVIRTVQDPSGYQKSFHGWSTACWSGAGKAVNFVSSVWWLICLAQEGRSSSGHVGTCLMGWCNCSQPVPAGQILQIAALAAAEWSPASARAEHGHCWLPLLLLTCAATRHDNCTSSVSETWD